MASVKPWALAAVLGCVVLALAYVPPRGAASTRRPPFFMQSPRGTPAREHARALADQWRAADGAWHLLTSRRDLSERIRALRDAGRSLVVLSESSGVVTAAAPLVDSAARLAWRALELGETKVGVVLVVQLASAAPRADRPLMEDAIATYLAPDSTDRTTCVAVVPAGRYWTQYFAGEVRGDRRVPLGMLVQFLKGGFGPCAFYAAYGTPSRTVRGWLIAQGWDLALKLDAGPHGRQSGTLFGIADPRYPWYWDAIYSLPPTAIACVASRPEGCRAVVLAGASDDPIIPVPDVVRITRRWDHPPRLVEGDRLLGDIAKSVGRDRFLSFWTSAQPVDTALAAALKRPVGEWTADWQRDFVQPIRLGPMPPVGALAIAGLIAVVAIGIVMLSASRRQVR